MIPVVWHNQSRGNWDHGIFLRVFDKYPDYFIQYNDKINPAFERAIVMCVGRPYFVDLKHYLEKIKYGVVIFVSEEDAFYNWKEVMHKGLEAWTQNWHQSTKSEIKRENRILLGAPHRIKDYKINKHLPKKYLWSFVGQIQNSFRRECIDVLRKMPDGYMKIVEGFGGVSEGGVEYQEYLDIICQSKFVICPSGSMTVETFRVFEAMECGAIPITDKRCPRDPENWNYWDQVCQNDLFAVNNWGELSDILKHEADMPPADSINDWWNIYKEELDNKFLNIFQ